MIRLNLFGILLSLAGILSASADSVSWALVRNSEPLAKIAIAEDATEVERYAARELQRALKKMSGAELPILVGNLQLQESGFIYIGTHFENLEEEEILVKSEQGNLFLLGGSPRAALYATYQFLEDKLGVRWFWPTESGEYIPQRQTIDMSDFVIRAKPSLAYRGLGITGTRFGYDEETDIWMARNRMNVVNTRPGYNKDQIMLRKQKGFMIRIAGHNVTLDRSILEKHPEYLAEFGGKRQFHQRHASHLCWSNPEVLELVVQKIAQWWDQNPEVDIVHFYPADHMQYCECAQCQQMGPDVSSRWQIFTRQILSELHERGYNGNSWSYAYQGYRDVPSRGIAPLGFNGYALYNMNYRSILGEGDPVNQVAESEMLAWQKLGAKVGIRGYEYIIFDEPMYVPLVSFAVGQMRWLKQHEMYGYLSEIFPHGHPAGVLPENSRWMTSRMTLYAAARAMWDTTVTPVQIVKEWTTYVYGKAAEPMERCYWLMEQAWRNGKKPISYFTHPASSNANQFITDELIEQVEQCLQQARELASQESDTLQRQRIQQQIELESKMLYKWRDLYRIQQGNAEHYNAWALKVDAVEHWPSENDWQRAFSLPAFQDKSGVVTEETTEVKLLWDEQAIYLKIHSEDSSPEQRINRFHDRDSNVWADDSIELFINPRPETNPGYYHLAFNTNDAQYDAVSLGGMSADKDWNPDWKVKTVISEKGWSAYVQLPFSEFGGSPEVGQNWRFAIKRTRPGKGRPNSGWPDASYHNPGGFGLLEFVDQLPEKKKTVLLYNPGYSDEHLVPAIYNHTQMQVVREVYEPELLQQAIHNHKPCILLLKYSRGRNFPLSDDFIREVIGSYVKEGGSLLIGAAGAIPLKSWFPDTELELQWSGWVGSNRANEHWADGEWARSPNDLRGMSKRLPPPSGYHPVRGEWQIIASMTAATEESYPYLLRTTVGRGTVYVASSNLGYGGGYEIFGNRRPQNVAMLIENLCHAHH